MMRKSFKTCLYVGSFFVLNFLCKGATDDFSTHFLIPPAKEGSLWDLKKEPPNLDLLLSQKYTYLTKGKQSYVFLSEDKKHVLKLFKPLAPFLEVPFFEKRLHIGLSKIPFAKSFLIHYNSPSFKEIQKLEFQSYQNSLFLFPEKTLLEYVHLTQTRHLKKTLKIYDKIGVLHTLDLDSTSFLIQQKTDLLYPTLSNLLKNKETEKVKLLLKNFVTFYFDWIEAGVVKPTTLEKNIGCLNLTPIQIDVGRILTNHDLGTEKVPLEQIYHSTSHMKKWLLQKAPDFSLFLDETIEEIMKTQRP